jgi:hypothetical protein
MALRMLLYYHVHRSIGHELIPNELRETLRRNYV